MRRPIVIALLSLGVLFGFGSGIARLSHGGGWRGHCAGYERYSREYPGEREAGPPSVSATATALPSTPQATATVNAAPAAPAAPATVSPTTVFVAPSFAQPAYPQQAYAPAPQYQAYPQGYPAPQLYAVPVGAPLPPGFVYVVPAAQAALPSAAAPAK